MIRIKRKIYIKDIKGITYFLQETYEKCWGSEKLIINAYSYSNSVILITQPSAVRTRRNSLVILQRWQILGDECCPRVL